MLVNLSGKHNAVRREPDKIWKTRLLKFEGMLAFIESLNRDATRTLVIAHFSDTFRSLNDLLTSKAAAFETYPTALEGIRLRELSEYQFAGRILLALAQTLPENLPSRQNQTATGDFEINLLVAEHHPLPSLDDRILEFAASLPCPSRVCFHDSLDGALIRHYGGAQVTQLMVILRMPDGEFISNPTIDKSIRRAQEKIARRVSSPMVTDSAEQWFQLYMPDGK